MRRLEWKVQAENDLFDLIGHDNPDPAIDPVQKIRTKVEGLRGERPTLCRAGRIRCVREMIVHRNYIALYRTSDEVVTILGVKHDHPFESLRDAVSERVAEFVEGAIKDVLTEARVSFQEPNRAERITGFDQAPGFMIPDEFNSVALIEAKLTEDDGTALDKVARVQRLRTLRDESGKDYDVIACLAGRGFKVRREDMRRFPWLPVSVRFLLNRKWQARYCPKRAC